MCVPPPLMAAAMAGAQAGNTIAEGFFRGNQLRNASREAANEARAVRERALRSEELRRRDARGRIGDLTARQSARGIRTDTGSTVAQAAGLARALEFDILQGRNDAEARAVALENEARAKRAEARFTKFRSVMRTVPGLLNDASGLASGGDFTVPSGPLS